MPVRLGRSGDVARIAKSTGHDFLFIDCQHSLFNLETIGQFDPVVSRRRVQAAMERIKGRKWHIEIYTRLSVIESLKDLVTNLAATVEKSLAELRAARAFDRVWWLLMSGALLGVMARAFKWI